jgi:hypothetical protein
MAHKHWAIINSEGYFTNKVWNEEGINPDGYNSETWIEIANESADVVDKQYNGTEWVTPEDTRTFEQKRADAYSPLEDQLDMIFHDLVDGTTIWKDKIQGVKDSIPKT